MRLNPPPCYAAIIMSQEADIQRLHDVVNAACARDVQHRIEVKRLRAILAALVPENDDDPMAAVCAKKFSTSEAEK